MKRLIFYLTTRRVHMHWCVWGGGGRQWQLSICQKGMTSLSVTTVGMFQQWFFYAKYMKKEVDCPLMLHEDPLYNFMHCSLVTLPLNTMQFQLILFLFINLFTGILTMTLQTLFEASHVFIFPGVFSECSTSFFLLHILPSSGIITKTTSTEVK